MHRIVAALSIVLLAVCGFTAFFVGAFAVQLLATIH